MLKNSFKDDMKNDKRKYERITINIPIRYRLINRDAPPKNVYSMNISAGGTRMALYVDESIAIGDLIEITLYLPSKMEPIKTIAEVKWVKEYYGETRRGFEVGVEYKDISKEDKKFIMQFVKEGLQM